MRMLDRPQRTNSVRQIYRFVSIATRGAFVNQQVHVLGEEQRGSVRPSDRTLSIQHTRTRLNNGRTHRETRSNSLTLDDSVNLNSGEFCDELWLTRSGMKLSIV